MKCYNSYDEFVLLVIDGRGRLCHMSQLGEVFASVADGREIFIWFFDEDGNEAHKHPMSLVVGKDCDDEGDSEECDS